MSINTDGAQRAFSEKMEASTLLPECLRREMLKVAHVGSFYSFLLNTCRAVSEQAGVSFSCNKAQGAGAVLQQQPDWGLAHGIEGIALSHVRATWPW